jgi:hypothetical protein
MSELAITVLFVYFIISLAIMLVALSDNECPPYYIVLWPVVLAKYLLRSLFFELFTGWRK